MSLGSRRDFVCNIPRLETMSARQIFPKVLRDVFLFVSHSWSFNKHEYWMYSQAGELTFITELKELKLGNPRWSVKHILYWILKICESLPRLSHRVSFILSHFCVPLLPFSCFTPISLGGQRGSRRRRGPSFKSTTPAAIKPCWSGAASALVSVHGDGAPSRAKISWRKKCSEN